MENSPTASQGGRFYAPPNKQAGAEVRLHPFLKTTGWSELNEALRTIHGKTSELLLVLDPPEIPLHNNLSENDIQQSVKKRTIRAGTRSEPGRRCRDTFLSLKTTCRKLGVTFWRYLHDRIHGVHELPPLAELIRQKAREFSPA